MHDVASRLLNVLQEKKFARLPFAIVGFILLLSYAAGLVGPLLALFFPRTGREELSVQLSLADMTLVVFALIIMTRFGLNPRKWTRRSIMVFPGNVYRAEAPRVSLLWLQIFSVAFVGSSAFFGLGLVYLYLNSQSGTYLYVSSLAAVATIPLAFRFRKLVLDYPSQTNLVAKVNFLLRMNAKTDRRNFATPSSQSDPFGWGRSEVASVARILDRMARRYDGSINISGQHPIAALYRAGADYLRRYCLSQDSMTAQLTFESTAVLLATEMVVIGTEPKWQTYLTKHLDVFGPDGKPRELTTQPLPGRFARAVKNLDSFTDRVNVKVQNSWKTILFIIALVLFSLGKLEFGEIVGIFK